MDEALIWIPITIAELLLLVSIALGIFLTRARKAERHLRAQLGELEKASRRPVAAAAPAPQAAPPPPPPPTRAEPPAPDLAGSPAYRNLDQLLPAAEAPPLDRCVEELQQRLHVTSECLGRVVAELHKEKTLSEHSQHELAALRQHLDSMAHEVEALRHTNARLQQELRSKKSILDGAVLEQQGSKEKILLYIKRLRDEIATLQLKLSSTEADMLRLRHQKDAITADYNMLTHEYERIYANFRK